MRKKRRKIKENLYTRLFLSLLLEVKTIMPFQVYKISPFMDNLIIKEKKITVPSEVLKQTKLSAEDIKNQFKSNEYKRKFVNRGIEPIKPIKKGRDPVHYKYDLEDYTYALSCKKVYETYIGQNAGSTDKLGQRGALWVRCKLMLEDLTLSKETKAIIMLIKEACFTNNESQLIKKGYITAYVKKEKKVVEAKEPPKAEEPPIEDDPVADDIEEVSKLIETED